jgi:A/G-specific adenine glycosylase
MLQQTRTETVVGYYQAFLAEFPDVYALAAASQEQVFKRWEGLGYYSRARNLQKAAQMIASEYNGKLPDTAAELLKLPGIGDYTAGAIASIAFGRKEPAMDGNLIRVMSRILDEHGCTADAAVRRRLKKGTEALMSGERSGDFNQAMMGLGNMICVPNKPKCEECPVSAYCRAKAQGTQAQLPVLPEKKEKKQLAVGVAAVMNQGHVLLVRRGEEGLLSGLTAFPAFEGARSEKDVREALQEMGIETGKGIKLCESQHVFTHRIWKMKGWLFKAKNQPQLENGTWADAEGMEKAAIPTAFKPYREQVQRLLSGEAEEKKA